MAVSGKNKSIITATNFLFFLAARLSAQPDFIIRSEYFYLKGRKAMSISASGPPAGVLIVKVSSLNYSSRTAVIQMKN
jgi:hypothetical protein